MVLTPKFQKNNTPPKIGSLGVLGFDLAVVLVDWHIRKLSSPY